MASAPKTRAKRLPQQTTNKAQWSVQVVPRIRVDGHECWGRCVWETRTILISAAAERNGIDRDTFLHEMIHKIMPFLDEEAVELLATELDEALDVMNL